MRAVLGEEPAWGRGPRGGASLGRGPGGGVMIAGRGLRPYCLLARQENLVQSLHGGAV